MNNIFKYIREYGEFTFDEKKVTEVDILIFSQIPYLNFEGFCSPSLDGTALSTLWEDAKKINTGTLGIAQRNAKKMLDMLSTKRRYKDLVLRDYVYYLQGGVQFGAISVVVPNDYIYVAFEGTDGTIWGWKEDFELSYTYPTGSQKMAADYLNNIIKFNGPKVVVCGHSKGGNLALVAAMNTNFVKKTRIEKIYSFDGPGLRREEFRSLNYKLTRNKLVNIIPNLSLVGVLLEQENVTVIKSNGIGIYQHDASTWTIDGDKLKRTVQDSLSKTLDESIARWLYKYNYEERKEIIEGIFSVLEEANIKSIYDIQVNKIKSVYAILKSSIDMSKETRDVILNSMKLLVSDVGNDIVNDGKKMFHDSIDKYFKDREEA